jgi:predicted acyl esterase
MYYFFVPETYMVKMRDGIELNTVVILNTTSPLPVVLVRTPYGTFPFPFLFPLQMK